MENLNAQTVLALILAGFVGLAIGWWLRGLRASKAGAGGSQEARAATGSVAPKRPDQPSGSAENVESGGSHPLEEIESIGKGFGARLNALDISTVDELLTKCRSHEAQLAIARKMDLEEFVVHKWVCIADLMRVPGVEGQFAELLEASGIQSVQRLAEQDPKFLVASMRETNARETRTRPVPAVEKVTRWIDSAKSLPKVLD